jgi:hypothetical protein
MNTGHGHGCDDLAVPKPSRAHPNLLSRGLKNYRANPTQKPRCKPQISSIVFDHSGTQLIDIYEKD